MTPSLFSVNRNPGQAATGSGRPGAEAMGAPMGGFAEQLQEQLQPAAAPQAGPHGPPPQAAAPKPSPDDADEAPPASRAAPAPKPRAPTPPAARSREAAPAERAPAAAKAPSAADAEVADEVTEATAPEARRSRGADTAADAPASLNWMLHLANRPQDGPSEAGAPALARGGAGKAAGLGRAGADALAAQAAAGPAGATGQAGFGADLNAQLSAQMGAALVGVATEAKPAPTVSATTALASVEAVAAALGAPAEVPAATQVTLGTPVNHPAFRDELAAQISSFAKDGVQEAVLTLNPAEMGPITVQIVMDGTQATIDFQAAQPATRDLIEGSLPSLASALHGEGLTLSGGSVGEQHSGRQPQHAPNPGRAAPPEPGAAEPLLAVRAAAQRHAGGLDLYA